MKSSEASGIDQRQVSMINGYLPPPVKKGGAKKYLTPVQQFGYGPDGAHCSTCKHYVKFRYSKVYIKCSKWILSNSASTDIRLKWPACGKYEEDEA